MKIDIKNLVIGALVILVALFLFLWISKSDTFLERENKRLNSEIIKIQKQRDSLADSRKNLEAEYKIIEVRIKEKETQIINLNTRIEQFRITLRNTEADLERERKKLSEIDKEIEKLRGTPFERVGQQLINSLKDKIK
jgi:chromosome segregation ATPase